MTLLHRCAPDPSTICFSATIDLAPVTKGRPRTGNGHTFTPQRTKDFEEKLGWLLKAKGARPVEGVVGVLLEFATRKIGDLDNYVKSFLDAGNGILYRDDSQVHHVCAVILRQEKSQFIRVTVYRMN